MFTLHSLYFSSSHRLTSPLTHIEHGHITWISSCWPWPPPEKSTEDATIAVKKSRVLLRLVDSGANRKVSSFKPESLSSFSRLLSSLLADSVSSFSRNMHLLKVQPKLGLGT